MLQRRLSLSHLPTNSPTYHHGHPFSQWRPSRICCYSNGGHFNCAPYKAHHAWCCKPQSCFLQDCVFEGCKIPVYSSNTWNKKSSNGVHPTDWSTYVHVHINMLAHTSSSLIVCIHSCMYIHVM